MSYHSVHIFCVVCWMSSCCLWNVQWITIFCVTATGWMNMCEKARENQEKITSEAMNFTHTRTHSTLWTNVSHYARIFIYFSRLLSDMANYEIKAVIRGEVFVMNGVKLIFSDLLAEIINFNYIIKFALKQKSSCIADGQDSRIKRLKRVWDVSNKQTIVHFSSCSH